MPEPVEYESRPPPPTPVKELSFTGPVRVIAFAAGGGVLGLFAAVGLWLIAGGWGPPSLLFFMGLGVVLGAIASFAKPAKRPPA